MKFTRLNRRALTAGLMVAWLATSLALDARAATMYSTEDSYMGAGTFYGPGKIDDTVLFGAVIRGIGFQSQANFVTPFVNNGGAEPNICGEKELGIKPTGKLSDGKTRLNESVSACALVLNDVKMLAGVVEGGPHGGEQIAVTLHDGSLLMTMDFALDMGIGEAGIIRIPFYGTTGEVTIPQSLQSQLGMPGGINRAGSMVSGAKFSGRLGDYNNDGMLDGAIAVAGNMPLSSIFLPGAPYALIRYFETDIPYDGTILGKLPGKRYDAGDEPPPFRIEAASKPAASTTREDIPGESTSSITALARTVTVDRGRKD